MKKNSHFKKIRESEVSTEEIKGNLVNPDRFFFFFK